jgi:hypothetical protein
MRGLICLTHSYYTARCDIVINAVYKELRIILLQVMTKLALLYAYLFISCLDYYTTLKTEAICFSETSMDLLRSNGIRTQKMALFIVTAINS